MQKYTDEYSKQYSCIVKSSKSNEPAFCTICLADISISHILPYFGALSPFFKLCRLSSLSAFLQFFLILSVQLGSSCIYSLHLLQEQPKCSFNSLHHLDYVFVVI